jgi:hypothetical protein
MKMNKAIAQNTSTNIDTLLLLACVSKTAAKKQKLANKRSEALKLLLKTTRNGAKEAYYEVEVDGKLWEVQLACRQASEEQLKPKYTLDNNLNASPEMISRLCSR